MKTSMQLWIKLWINWKQYRYKEDNMEIWLNNGNDKIRLPILPSSFEVESSQQNISENVHRKGEVNLLGKRNLKTIEISSFFPNHDYPFCQYHGFQKPYIYVKKIEGWKDSNVTPRLIITGEADINMEVSIENFKYGENDATGDVNFTINLKEYIVVKYSKPAKKTNTKTGKKVNKKAATTLRSILNKLKNGGTIYKVKKGDTLLKIAKKKTGKSSNWTKIYNLNKKTIEKAAKKHKRKSSSKGKYLYAGTKLVIPK